MLKSEARFQEITEKLGCLTYYVQLCNQQGMTNINHLAEDFFCGLLNIIYDVKLSNMNYIERNYPAIDLGDKEGGLAIQVTSTNSRSKIEYTLEKFFEKNQDQYYNRLIVLIIGKKDSYRKKFDTKRKFRFEPAMDIIDTATLCEEIMKLDDDKHEEVLRYLAEKMDVPQIAPQQPAPAPAPRPVFGEKRLKYTLPSTVGFVGREKELSRLETKLRDDNCKLFFITGLGGMGKTELAVHFGQKIGQDYKVHFARFTDSFRHTVSQSVALGIENLWLNESRPEEDIYRDAMAVLRECGPETVLIIDNADPADDRDFEQLKDETYRDLCAMKLRLVITTRAPVPGGVAVEPMSNEDLLMLMRNHKPDLPETDADALIEAVNGHTLTLDLMARAMVGGWKRVTPAMLLEALRNHNLSDSIGKTVATDYNRDTQENAQRKIHEHLRTVFRVADIPDNAKQVMACATLLPEGGMDADLFANALPADAQEALDTLADRAWLRVSNANLATIHPVIRLICCEELKPNDEICRAFLENLWGNYDKKKFDHDRYSAMAELYTTAAEMLENKRGGWSGRARALWNKVGQYEKALSCAGMTIDCREAALPPDHPDLADAYNDMGLVYQDFRNHRGMAEYYGKALEIRRRVLAGDHVDLAKSYNNVGVAYGEKCDYQTALTYKLKAMHIFEKILPLDDLDLARSYNHVGITYGDLGDHHKALEYHEKVLRINEKVLPSEHPDLARSYVWMGSTYGALGDHRRALEYQEKALGIYKKVLPPDHPDLALSYNNVGITYDDLGDHRKALEYQEKALGIYKKVLPPNHPDLALSYNNVGITYDDLGDHRKALEYLEKALRIRERVLLPDHPELADTYFWMGRTYGDMGKYSLALEYLEKALRIREAKLPPGHGDIKITRDSIAHYKRKLERPSWMSQIQ